MSRAVRLLLLAGLPVLSTCRNFAVPETEPALRLDYPTGYTADFPHQIPGAVLDIAVRVTEVGGAPAIGVEVVWDDGYATPAVTPWHTLTDSTGMVTAKWEVRPLPAEQFSRDDHVRAYLPGALNSPLEYRAIIHHCYRNCP